MSVKLTENLSWSSAMRTHVGKVRELNEDAVLDRPDVGLWAVADGMGGHQGGDRASRLVIDALAALPQPFAGLSDFADAARRELEAVNRRLHDEARNGAGSISGSTVATLLAHGRRGAAIWAGDSRVYRFRDKSLQALSRDHSQIEEWVVSGLLDRRQAGGHPACNVITRAVGAAHRLELDTIAFDVQPGDAFILCSDGLYNEVDEEQMSRILDDADSQQAVEQLLAAALAGAARDNISVVVARADPHPSDTTKTVINPAFSGRQHGPAEGK
jgi:protein phosphatase